MPDFLNIPGNIRQQYMPFTIKGSDAMQLFTFKEKMRKADSKGGVAIIHPFSKHLGTLIQNDSSISYTHGPDGQKKITYNEFLDAIPSLQIREFVPDAKLTQTFKWFSYLKKGFDNTIHSLDSMAASGVVSVKGILEDALKQLSNKMKGLTSGNAPILGEVVGGLRKYYKDRGFNVGEDAGLAVLWLPFLLYYRLTTTHTNNIYEFPTLMQNNILESDGTYGWGDDNGSDFPILDVLGNKARSIVGLASSGLATTIKVNAMPAFSPTGSAAATSFDIHIDLVNDSEEAAINNFLFCHTLFGNNRWLQYGFVQTGASLYDVKFPGANRYFMCKGKFTCKGKGAFRTPGSNIIQGILKHANNKMTAKKAWETMKFGDKTIAQSIGEAEARTQIERTAKILNESQRNFSIRAPVNWKSQEASQFINLQASNLKTRTDALKTKTFSDGSTVGSDGLITIKRENGTTEAYNVSNAADYFNAHKAEIETANSRIAELNGQKNAFLVQKNDLEKAIKILDDGASSDSQKEEARKTLAKYDMPSEAAAIEWVSAENTGFSYEMSWCNGQIDEWEKEIQKIRNFEGDPKALQEFKDLSKANATAAADEASETIDTGSPIWRDLIKIPDVYSLTLTFSSLIPDNFNNYLYGWRAANLDPIKNYFEGNVNEIGAMEDLVNNLVKAVGG